MQKLIANLLTTWTKGAPTPELPADVGAVESETGPIEGDASILPPAGIGSDASIAPDPPPSATNAPDNTPADPTGTEANRGCSTQPRDSRDVAGLIFAALALFAARRRGR